MEQLKELSGQLPNENKISKFKLGKSISPAMDAFSLLGISREHWVKELKKIVMQDYAARASLVKEIHEAFLNDLVSITLQSKIWEKLYQNYEQQKTTYVELCKQTSAVLKAQNQLPQNDVDLIEHLEKLGFIGDSRNLNAKRLQVQEAEHQLYAYYIKPSVISAYLNGYNLRLNMGYLSFVLYAKQQGSAVYLLKSSESASLKLCEIYQSAETKNAIYLLIGTDTRNWQVLQRQELALQTSLKLPLSKWADYPLHQAVKSFNLAKVQSCLKAGYQTSINELDHYGDTPLHILALIGMPFGEKPPTDTEIKVFQQQKLALLQLLVEAGADGLKRNREGATPLLLTCQAYRSHPIVEFLLKKWPLAINIADFEGNYPIHHAALKGHSDILELLLKKGAYLDMPNTYDETPLHLAALKGKTEVIKTMFKLFEQQAKVNVKDFFNIVHKEANQDVARFINISNWQGDTPLHMAATQGWQVTLEILLAQGADLQALNDAGLRPYDKALEYLALLSPENAKEHPLRKLLLQHKSSSATQVLVNIKAHQLSPQEELVALEQARRQLIVQLIKNDKLLQKHYADIEKIPQRVALYERYGKLYENIYQNRLGATPLPSEAIIRKDEQAILQKLTDIVTNLRQIQRIVLAYEDIVNNLSVNANDFLPNTFAETLSKKHPVLTIAEIEQLKTVNEISRQEVVAQFSERLEQANAEQRHLTHLAVVFESFFQRTIEAKRLPTLVKWLGPIAQQDSSALEKDALELLQKDEKYQQFVKILQPNSASVANSPKQTMLFFVRQQPAVLQLPQEQSQQTSVFSSGPKI